MTDFQFEQDAYSPREARRIRAGKKAIVGLAGLAAMGAGGLFFFTTAIPAKDQIVNDAGALGPNRAPASASASVSPSPSRTPDSPYVSPSRRPSRSTKPQSGSTPARDGVALQRSPVPMTNPSLSLQQRLAIAQPAASGLAVPSPVPQQVTVAEVPPPVTVTESGSMRADGTTLRVVSAPGNLTGQRELAWVADAGIEVGSSHCSQTFHRSAGAPAGEIPSLLVCWRLSSGRSVIAVAVSDRGRPSSATAVAAIDRRWKALAPAPRASF